MQNLEQLTLNVERISNFHSNTMIHSKSLKEFNIYSHHGDELKYFPFWFDKLGRLTFNFKSELTENFYYFIDRHSAIKRLIITNLKTSRRLTVYLLVRLLKALPLLTNLGLDGFEFTIDYVHHLVSSFRLLRRFVLCGTDCNFLSKYELVLWQVTTSFLGELYLERSKVTANQSK